MKYVKSHETQSANVYVQHITIFRQDRKRTRVKRYSSEKLKKNALELVNC